MIGYTSFEILSGNVAAIDLGITSEISIITIVTIADAIPTFTPISIAKIVTSVGKIIFATLLPINIVVINSLDLSNNFVKPCALRSPFLASV